MGFFDNFKLLNKKSGYVVRYKNDTLMTIKPLTLKAIVLDNLSKKLITEIKQRRYKLIDSVRSVCLSLKHVPDLQKYKDSPNFLKRYERYDKLRTHIIESGFKVKRDERIRKWVDAVNNEIG